MAKELLQNTELNVPTNQEGVMDIVKAQLQNKGIVKLITNNPHRVQDVVQKLEALHPKVIYIQAGNYSSLYEADSCFEAELKGNSGTENLIVILDYYELNRRHDFCIAKDRLALHDGAILITNPLIDTLSDDEVLVQWACRGKGMLILE